MRLAGPGYLALSMRRGGEVSLASHRPAPAALRGFGHL